MHMNFSWLAVCSEYIWLVKLGIFLLLILVD